MRNLMKGGKAKRGFTLIELMIVVAIIGILAAIAIPKFAALIRKSNEGATKGNLGAIRSALSIYYGDMEGTYPTNMSSLTVSSKYLGSIPKAKVPSYHGDSSAFVNNSVMAESGGSTGGWRYNNVVGDTNLGTMWVNCTHTDSKNTEWTVY